MDHQHHRHAPDLNGLTDRFGAVGSLLCALHCAALPFLLAAVPGVGLGLLAEDGFESGFTLFATLLAVTSLWQGYRRHRAFRAWMFLVPGLLALWLGAFYAPLHETLLPHAIVMTVGGTLIAAAHVLNLRLLHGHVHDASCRH